jgi:hypothetical protein
MSDFGSWWEYLESDCMVDCSVDNSGFKAKYWDERMWTGFNRLWSCVRTVINLQVP